MQPTFLNSYSVTNPRITNPELLAEREKYPLRLRRSPHLSQQTAAHDLARQLDGAQDQRPGQPWFYHHHGHFYKRALSGYLVIASDIQFFCTDSD
jgi:hypothetical protein